MGRSRFETSKQRQSLKQRAVEHKGGACQICGYNRSLAAMDFHHVDDMEKDFAISTRTSWDAIARELDKCVLLCCRCHREVHDGYHHGFLQLEDRGGGGSWEDLLDEPEDPTSPCDRIYFCGVRLS